VDLRSRRVFAAGHLAGSLGFELGNTLAPQLGWLLPAGTPVTLLGETAGQVATAQRELARIGVDRPAAIATGQPEEWAAGEPLASFPVRDFAALAAARRDRPVTVLDVRRNLEWAAGHVDGAVHLPLHELAGRLGEIPGGELWVHCQAGYRAAVAASLLQAAHRQVIAIDDDFGHASEAGLPVVREPVVRHPVVRHPVVRHPVAGEPVVQEQVVQEQVVQEQVVQEQVVQEQVVQEQVVQDPVVPPPVAAEPARLAAAQSSGGRLRTSAVPR